MHHEQLYLGYDGLQRCDERNLRRQEVYDDTRKRTPSLGQESSSMESRMAKVLIVRGIIQVVHVLFSASSKLVSTILISLP